MFGHVLLLLNPAILFLGKLFAYNRSVLLNYKSEF